MLARLSVTERRVLDLIATGAQNKEIADLLDITSGTVKVHLKAVYKKINVRNRTQAAVAVLMSSAMFDTEVQRQLRDAVALHLEFSGPLVLSTFGQVPAAVASGAPLTLRLVE